MKLFVLVFTIALCCFFLSGCFTRIHERHLFHDNLRYLPNYYKIKVKGGTFLFSKTRYYSGYFDPDAINIYFNGFAQPKEGKLKDSLAITSVDGNNADKQLVLIMSSNAEAIAQQIGNLAQSKSTLANLVSITNGEKQQHLSDIQSDLAIQSNRNELFLAQVEGTLAGLENKDTTQVRTTLLRVLNQIADDQGNTKTFLTWQDAQNWLSTFKNIPQK